MRHALLPSVGCAVLTLLLPACHDSEPQDLVVRLRPGDKAYTSIEIDAVGSEDELYHCVTQLLDLNLSEADIDIISQGATLTQCLAQIEIKTYPDTPPGHYRLRTETIFSYWDHFFEDEREGSEVTTIWIEILGPR